MTDVSTQTTQIPITDECERVREQAKMEIIKSFAEAGYKMGRYGNWAMKGERHEIVQLLAKCRIPINDSEGLKKRNTRGLTSLTKAVIAGQKGAVESLLKMGANPDDVDGSGLDAIQHAKQCHRGKIATLLRKYSMTYNSGHPKCLPILPQKKGGPIEGDFDIEIGASSSGEESEKECGQESLRVEE